MIEILSCISDAEIPKINKCSFNLWQVMSKTSKPTDKQANRKKPKVSALSPNDNGNWLINLFQSISVEHF